MIDLNKLKEIQKKRNYDNPYPEPEWDARNMNRKQGETTFGICGWCRHASCGSCRYDCHIETKCSLLKDYFFETLYWDTPCLINLLSKEDMLSMIESKEYEISSARKNIKDLKEEIETIKNLKLVKRPPLPDNRIEDFKINETVWVFTSKQTGEAGDNKWHKGTVTYGYRTGDGCVSYVLEDFPQTKGKPWGCGVSVPCILKNWEYQYFKKHLDEFLFWLTLCDRKYNGDKLNLEDYHRALENQK